MYRIGILGCGRISKRHFSAAANYGDRAQITAACDLDSELLDQACANYEVALRFSRVEDLAASDEVDVVVVLTPPHVRLSVIQPLLEAGKHLLVEKPFTESMDEARAIVDLADRLGRQVAVNQNYRWFDVITHSRQLIQAGRIGRPTYAIIHDCVWRDELSGWRADTQRLALAVMGVHWLDRLRWLLDDDAVAVTSITAARDTLASGGENETTSIIEFSQGAMATLTHSWSSQTRGAVNFQQYDGPLGSLVLHEDTDVTLYAGEEVEKQRYERDFVASFGESLLRLLDAIDSGEEAAHSARDNLRTMALLEACYQSAAEKRRVEIAPE